MQFTVSTRITEPYTFRALALLRNLSLFAQPYGGLVPKVFNEFEDVSSKNKALSIVRDISNNIYPDADDSKD